MSAINASTQAALIYQEATGERDEAIAQALSQIALTRTTPLSWASITAPAGLAQLAHSRPAEDAFWSTRARPPFGLSRRTCGWSTGGRGYAGH
jgi:hypothetical protein